MEEGKGGLCRSPAVMSSHRGITIWREHILCAKDRRSLATRRIPGGGRARCKSAPGPSDDIRWRKERGEGGEEEEGLGSDPAALLYTSGERTPHTVLICRPTVCAFVSRPSEPLSLRKADWLYITSRCNAAGMSLLVFASVSRRQQLLRRPWRKFGWPGLRRFFQATTIRGKFSRWKKEREMVVQRPWWFRR